MTVRDRVEAFLAQRLCGRDFASCRNAMRAMSEAGLRSRDVGRAIRKGWLKVYCGFDTHNGHGGGSTGWVLVTEGPNLTVIKKEPSLT